MAKKKTSLTPEQRLQDALVPENEWPYQVPKNWYWVKLGNIANFERGITFPASAKEHEQSDSNIPCLRTANVQETLEIDDLIYVDKCFMKENPQKLVCLEDIIMSSANSRELVGKTSYVECVPFPMTFGGFVLNIRARNIASRLLFYYLRLEFLSGKFMGESTQTTNIANINTTTLGNYSFPLPPLPEQKRIVDRIESLFAKLDEAKQNAQDVLDGFETRKAAILHKAFTGELSKYWRSKHLSVSAQWHQKPLSEVTINHDSERIPLSQTERNGLKKIYDYYGASGVIDKVETYLFDKQYLLIGEDGANLVMRSKPIAFLAEGKYWVNNHAHVLDTKEEMSMKFLCYYINSIDLIPYVSGSAQPKLTQAKMNKIPIPVPVKDEQQEIVRILDDLLSKEQQAKEAAESVLEQIDLIKKSILARAFRGELGTNDPAEESSVELLKEILEKEA